MHYGHHMVRGPCPLSHMALCLCYTHYALHGSLRSAIGLVLTHPCVSLVFHTGSHVHVTSCVYMSGGLLRKPPLKGARITHVARVPSVHSLNMDTYRRTVPKVQPAYLCMGLRPAQTYVCAHEVCAHVRPLELVHKVVHYVVSVVATTHYSLWVVGYRFTVAQYRLTLCGSTYQ